MGLIDREYMSETYRENEQANKKQDKNKQAMQQELFRLYAKKNKSFFDRWKIKRIENKFRKS